MKRLFLLVIISCLTAVGCNNDNNNGGGGSNQPTIVSITPTQVSRGQLSIEGVIQGTNLAGVLSVNLGDGITVEQVTGISASEVHVRFSVNIAALPGARTISITTSAGTATVTALLTVENNRAPIAKFNVTPTSGAKNTNFLFDGSDSSDVDGVVAIYHWKYGDNQEANGRITTHRYAAPGSYTVTLIVSDRNNSSNQATKTVEVISGQAPTPHFSFTPSSGEAGTVFQFDASASSDKDGKVAKAEWNFGDGVTAVGLIVTHRFLKSGTFEVVLTITDDDGLESSLGKDVRIDKFNEQAAIQEIQDVSIRFFKRFSKLEKLKAEQIVVDWSDSSDCTGRDKEIQVIEHQQQILQKTNAEVVGDIPVFIHPEHTIANANVFAKFNWVEKDGTKGSGDATHHFEFHFEDGQWLVCNFTVDSGNTVMKSFFEQ
jgi:PKD repeat protein